MGTATKPGGVLLTLALLITLAVASLVAGGCTHVAAGAATGTLATGDAWVVRTETGHEEIRRILYCHPQARRCIPAVIH